MVRPGAADMTPHRRRVHLAPGRAGAFTVCGLVAAALGNRGTARASWQDVPPHWRCPQCARRLHAWHAARQAPAAAPEFLPAPAPWS